MFSKRGPKIEHLVHTEDLQAYQEKTQTRVQVALPLEYLRRGSVVALVHRNPAGQLEEILGGFSLIREGPFRSLEQIPQKLLAEDAYLKKCQNRCFEINGFWIDHQEAPPCGRFRIWISLLIEVLKTAAQGKFYFVYSYESHKGHLEKIYSNFAPKRVFQGEVRQLEGMEGASWENVEVSNLKRLTKGTLKNPSFVINRMKKKRRVSLHVEH